MTSNKEGIGDIDHYGSLFVRNNKDKYEWSITSYDGHYWEEIPEKLYNALIEFEVNRGQDNQT